MNFKSINDIKFDDILKYCKDNNKVEWLKDKLTTNGLTDKEGKARKYSFMELRLAFIKEFPEFNYLIPKKKEKPLSMLEKVMQLK